MSAPNPTTATGWLLEAIEDLRSSRIFLAPVAAVARYDDVLNAQGVTSDVIHRLSDAIRDIATHLRQIVELHANIHGGICVECDDVLWPCRTIRAVAEVFRERDGYAIWFGGGA